MANYIKLFVLLLQVLLTFGRWLERKGVLKEAVQDVEKTLGKTTAEMVERAVRARDSVSHDPDSVQNDPLNRDPEGGG